MMFFTFSMTTIADFNDKWAAYASLEDGIIHPIFLMLLRCLASNWGSKSLSLFICFNFGY